MIYTFDMKVVKIDSSRSNELNEFVKNHDFGSIEQSWEWGELQTTIKGRDDFFVFAVIKDAKIIASALLIKQSLRFKKSWLWCPRGPLLPENADESLSAWTVLKKELTAFALKNNCIFIRFESAYPCNKKIPLTEPNSKTSYLPENTLILNIAHSEESILKQMTQKGRYNIKQAKKHNIYVKICTVDCIDEFYDLLIETGERDGFHVHGKYFYRNLIEILGDNAKLYIAYNDSHTALGALIATHFGQKATYYFGASTNKYAEKMAPYLLQWSAILDAKMHGMTEYDFLGIAPLHAKKHALIGVTQFKTRFGGKRLDYHGAQVLTINAFWTRLYNFTKFFSSFLKF